MFKVDVNLKGTAEVIALPQLAMDFVGQDFIDRAGLRVQLLAKRNAPVNKQIGGGGHLRGSIHYYAKLDGMKSEAEVGTDVFYAPYVELGTKPHTIEVRFKKVLANRRTGQFFGKKVNHPGTKAQPYLAPAIEVLKSEMAQRISDSTERAKKKFGV